MRFSSSGDRDPGTKNVACGLYMLICTVQLLWGASVNPRMVMLRITNGWTVREVILGETAKGSVRLVRRQTTSLSWRWKLQSNQLFAWPVALASTLNVAVLVVISSGGA
jgi:hypothetical protein